jgi:hypothetical protein
MAMHACDGVGGFEFSLFLVCSYGSMMTGFRKHSAPITQLIDIEVCLRRYYIKDEDRAGQ